MRLNSAQADGNPRGNFPRGSWVEMPALLMVLGAGIFSTEVAMPLALAFSDTQIRDILTIG